MAHFITRLELEAADDTDSGVWLVAQPLIYASDVAKSVIIVPRGFRTDLASVPRVPVVYLVTGGVGTTAAVVHDWIYASGQFSRKMADDVFHEACGVLGVPGWRRWLLWAGVRIGGSSFYNKAATA